MAGDSGGVRGPPPTQAQEIIKNLFEGDKKKKLDSQQQAEQIRQQAHTQEDLRRGVQESGGEDHRAEGGERGRDANRAQASQQASRSATETVQKETEMDAFLSRSSHLYQQQEAGKELNRPQTMASVSAQAWSVANSPQTPESARSMIMARQQAAQPLQQPLPQTPTQSLNPSLQTQRGAQVLPFTPRQETPPGLQIRYVGSQPEGSETHTRGAFANRSFLPENLTRAADRLVQDQMQMIAQRAFANAPPIAVQLRGNLVFVKDGKEFRAFRFNKDGTLTELPTEDSNGQPLSAEAQNLLQKVLRQKGLHHEMEGMASGEAEEIPEEKLAEELAKQIDQKGAGDKEELDFETRFALLLHEVLEEDRDIGEKLKDGETIFAEKKEWEAFFARMLGLGNEEKNAKKAMEAILSMIFRGLFKKKGQGDYLVGDFKFLQGSRTKEEKFAQIKIGDGKLLQWLAQLKPGEKIDPNNLRQLFGEELSYLQLKHITEKLFNLAQGAEKNVVFNPKAQVDPYSQARLERSMFATRQLDKTLLESEAAAAGLPFTPDPKGFFANTYEWLGLRERYRGKPRLYTFIAYALMTAVVAIAIGVILMKAL